MDFPDDLRGIVTVLNTPFTEEDAIDVAGLERHVGYARRSGVTGFLAPAMAGEVDFLRDDERETVVATVVKHAGGLPVIGGASAAAAEDRVRWTRRLTELGCDGVLVSVPYIDDAQYEGEVRQIADARPRFLMLQDWSRDGDGVPVPLLARLFQEIPCFTCLKIEVGRSGPKYTRVLAETMGKLHVSGGWAVTEMMDGLARGVHAFMPTAMHHTYTRIYSLYAEGRVNAAAALFSRLKPLLEYTNQDLACSIHFFKHLLHAQGVYATTRIRQPLSQPVDERRCQDMIALAQLLEFENHRDVVVSR